jgi:hypothetical protein
MYLQKIQYLLRSIASLSQAKRCPNCGENRFIKVDSKYFVTKLYKCLSCKLNFRYPIDSPEFLNRFYQTEYKANYSSTSQQITDLPNDNELQEMIRNNFYGRRDYSPYAEALLKSNQGRVLDYGCSWGYSVFQLVKSGFDAEGFEISIPRAAFGEKLGVTIFTSPSDVHSELDLILSSHTIEHLPRISLFTEYSRTKLREEGYFVAFCPNGSAEYREREPHTFHVNWGFLHPNYLDIEFACEMFKNNPFLVLTGDWTYNLNEIVNWDPTTQIVGSQRDGHELLIISRPNVYLR